MPKIRVAIGADEAGYQLKERIRAHLEALNIEVSDYGPALGDSVDYPDVAHALAFDVADGQFQRGLLICGTGIGMAIAANKVPGIRAAQAHDTYSAQRARKSNDAQILTIGARVVGEELALEIVNAWLDSEFEGGNSTRKVAKIELRDGAGKPAADELP